MAPSIHPLVDNGFSKGDPNFPGGKLRCHCKSNPIEVELSSNVAHNHVCGCSKCWKPAGALFSLVAAVPRDKVRVVSGGDKLRVVDKSAAIQRNACSACGVHLFGRIEIEHPLHGFDFVHVELSDAKGWQEPQFAAFVSSIIEQGFNPSGIDDIRARLNALGLQTYDSLSPPLMDAIATWTAQKNGKLPKKL